MVVHELMDMVALAIELCQVRFKVVASFRKDGPWCFVVRGLSIRLRVCRSLPGSIISNSRNQT